MFRVRAVALVLSFLLVMLLGSIASSQCDPDTHNDATTALEIGFDETVTDYVCPDDSFDYYYFTVPDTGDVSGMITFAAEQSGTTLRIEDPTGAMVFPDRGTLDAERTFWIPVAAGSLLPGNYYIRVSHYSAYDIDHEYTITMDLTLTGGSECVPDGNEDPASASAIAFGTTVDDWVCAVDHLDIWHFRVTSASEGSGSIILTADPGELTLYLYDSAATELYNGRTSGGNLNYSLGTPEAPLANGEYYIGVFLPIARTDENSYSLSLRAGSPSSLSELGPTLGNVIPLPSESKCPWPSARGNVINAGRSWYNGPAGDMYRSMEYDDLEFSVSEMEDGGKYSGLLYANDDIIVFFEKSRRTVRAVTARDTSRFVFSIVTGSEEPPVLDNDGLMYYIEAGGNNLMCVNVDTGHVVWRLALQQDDLEYLVVEMVGKHIYVTGNPPHRTGSAIYVYDRQGDVADIEDRTGSFLWEKLGIDGRAVGVAEDRMYRRFFLLTNRNVYCYTFEFDEEGRRNVWSPGGGYMNVEQMLPPIVGRDRNVWTYIPNIMTWKVYRPGGGIFKEGSYGEKLRAACIDIDGRLYVATDDNITCYENWDEEVWSVRLGQFIDDMVIGADGKLYVTQLYYLSARSTWDVQKIITFDSNDGSITNEYSGMGVNTNVIGYLMDEDPEGINNSFLAIGEGGKLAFLHSSGLLQVYSPPLRVMYFTPLEVFSGSGDE